MALAPPPPPERRCKAQAKRGGQCPGWTAHGGDLCALHSPRLGAKGRAKNPIKPGEARGGWTAHVEAQAREERIQVEVRLKLRQLESIPATLELIAEDVSKGDITAQEGQTLATLARAAIAAHTAIDELAERAHKRRTGLTDEQIEDALRQLREVHERRESLS